MRTTNRVVPLLADVLIVAGCNVTVKQKPPEVIDENQSGWVDDEDGSGSHWETNEVKGAKFEWGVKVGK
jgi:hypothetical protein